MAGAPLKVPAGTNPPTDLAATHTGLTVTEKEIQGDILSEFGGKPYVRLWRSNCGVGVTPDGERVVSFGLPGQADLSGILHPDGRRLEIEVKSEHGTQSKRQQAFQRMIDRFGGVYILARSVDDVRAVLCEQGYPRC